MKVFNGVGDLSNDVTAQIFAEIGQSHDLMEKLAPRAEFQNDVVVLARFGEIDQLDDIGVIQVAHNLDLLEDVCALWGKQQVSTLEPSWGAKWRTRQ